MYPQTSNSLYEPMLDSSNSIPVKSRIEMSHNPINSPVFHISEDVSLVHNTTNKNTSATMTKRIPIISVKPSAKMSANFDKSRNKATDISALSLLNLDKSRIKGKDISVLNNTSIIFSIDNNMKRKRKASGSFDRSRNKAKDISQNLDRSRNKGKDVSILSNSFGFSFDNNLKQQMEQFKYKNLNEIFEEDEFHCRSRDIYSEEIVDKCPEVPLFDVTNKFINLLSDLIFRRVLFVVHVLIILIRILLMVFFHYWLPEDPDFNFVYLILIYAPRFFYMLTMSKILFQPSTEDFFLERVCQGFNVFDGAVQNEMKKQMKYDLKLNFNELAAKNVTKFYKEKTQRFFQTLSNSVKPIFRRLFLIISPVEINYLILLYLFRNLEESNRLVRKLMLISAWIYQSYEVLCLTPCVVLMALNEEIRGKALSLDLTFDLCVFFILGVEVFAVLVLVVYLLFTRNENVLKGPARVF